MKDLYDVKCGLEDMDNMPCRPYWARPKETDVIDENKSVKWNREEVIKLQEKYDSEARELNAAKSERRDEIYKEAYKIIRQDVKGITIEDARRIFQYAYSEWWHCGYDEMFKNLEELIALISSIVNGEND